MAGLIEKEPSVFRAGAEQGKLKNLAEKLQEMGKDAATNPAKSQEFEQTIKGILASAGILRIYCRRSEDNDPVKGDNKYQSKLKDYEEMVKNTSKAVGIPEELALKTFKNPPMDENSLNEVTKQIVTSAKNANVMKVSSISFGLNKDALNRNRQVDETVTKENKNTMSV